jgi:hypothetical protein
MAENKNCPELEELAAWADGRGDDHRRQAIVDHLDRCPDCYDLAAGAIAFRQEADSARQAPLNGTVVSFHAAPRWAVPVAAAAVLLLAAVLIAVAPIRVAGPEPSAGIPPVRTVPADAPGGAPAPPPLPAGVEGNRLPAMVRHDNVFVSVQAALAEPGVDPAALATEIRLPEPAAYGFGAAPANGWFRLGARWVEAELHARAGDRPAAADTLAQLRQDLNRLGGATELLPEYDRAEAALRRGDETGLSPALFARTLAAGGERGAARMELGTWMGGGRIAARTGNGAYFKHPEIDRLEAGLTAAGCPPGIAAAFDEIRRQIDAGLPNAASFRRTDRALVDIGLLMRGE